MLSKSEDICKLPCYLRIKTMCHPMEVAKSRWNDNIRGIYRRSSYVKSDRSYKWKRILMHYTIIMYNALVTDYGPVHNPWIIPAAAVSRNCIQTSIFRSKFGPLTEFLSSNFCSYLRGWTLLLSHLNDFHAKTKGYSPGLSCGTSFNLFLYCQIRMRQDSSKSGTDLYATIRNLESDC